LVAQALMPVRVFAEVLEKKHTARSGCATAKLADTPRR
jgi:hypothetical protein